MPTIRRERAALRRSSISLPVQLALTENVLSTESSFFDYGCGFGGDIARLKAIGLSASGWDPHYRSEVKPTPADVVNIGYVINVIENDEERRHALERAWSLAAKVLIVAGRTVHEKVAGSEYRDGRITSTGTFQKFYEQIELRNYIETVLGAPAVAVAPGIFFVFREAVEREAYTATRTRRAAEGARVTRTSNLYQENRVLVDELISFFLARGRIPVPDETDFDSAVRSGLGSWRQAQTVIRAVLDPEQFERVKNQGLEDLTVYLALAGIRGRPRMTELPKELAADVRGFFGSYRRACEVADASLRALADPGLRQALADVSEVGKRTRSALYIHVSAIPELLPSLRIYSGFADVIL